jgi:hypothetical protein
MAIIVLLSALSYAAFQMIQENTATESASDEVRAQWARARSLAIQNNVPYVFGVVWNESAWRIAPEGSDYWDTGASTAQDDQTDSPSNLPVEVGSLEGGIRFVENDAASLSPAAGKSQDPKSFDVSRFTPLVWFKPDGSIEPAPTSEGTTPEMLHVNVEGKSKGRVAVSMRALTGVTTKRWKMPGERNDEDRGSGSGDR